MRAYIKHSENIKELAGVKFTENQKQWVYESGESFHGEISDTRDSFVFMDHRLPDLELPLSCVEIDE